MRHIRHIDDFVRILAGFSAETLRYFSKFGDVVMTQTDLQNLSSVPLSTSAPVREGVR